MNTIIIVLVFFVGYLISMPRCKNDTKRFYTGKEPSPKGRGYCAHAERVGSVRVGTDRLRWVVRKISTGVKRWTRVGTGVPKSLSLPKISPAKYAETTREWEALNTGS